MLNIITQPNEVLRKPSAEIERDFLLSSEIQTFISEMIKTMYTDDGIGLAAPQVGRNIRVCIIGKEALKKDNFNTLPTEEDLVLINPIWNKKNRKKNWDVEGCLSVPKTFGKVKRYSNISVQALNKKGEEIVFDANDFFARVIQHEVDHLDGVLFIDKAKSIYNTD